MRNQSAFFSPATELAFWVVFFYSFSFFLGFLRIQEFLFSFNCKSDFHSWKISLFYQVVVKFHWKMVFFLHALPLQLDVTRCWTIDECWKTRNDVKESKSSFHTLLNSKQSSSSGSNIERRYSMKDDSKITNLLALGSHTRFE